MLRKLVGRGICATVGAFAIAVSFGAVFAADKDVPSIHDIMEDGHSGKKSLFKKIETAVGTEKWADAAAPSAKLKAFGVALGKNKPEKGSETSWKALAAKYAKNTAAIAVAVEKKDKTAADAAIGAMKKSCKECHDAHQP